MSVALSDAPIADSHTEPPKPFGGFSPSKAGQISGAQRRRQAARNATIDKLSLELLPAVERLVNVQQALTPSQTPALAVLESHIERLDAALSKAEHPADFRDLAQARSKLFEQWAHLAGIPKPMAGREPRQSQRRVSLTPIDIDPPAVPSTQSAPAQIPEVNRDVTP